MRPFSVVRLDYRLLAVVVLLAAVVLAVGQDVASASGGVVVDSTGDADARDGVVTLREAILLATGDLAVASLDAGEADNVSGSPGAGSTDTITFSEATFPEGVPQEIALGSGLPDLKMGGDTIDGTGAGVVITSVSGTDDCLTLGTAPLHAGDANVVRALEVHGCGTAITIESDDNLVSSVVVYGSGTGIDLDSGSRNNDITSSIIGTDAAGTPGIGSETGIQNDGGHTTIGGPNAADGNVISGNASAGIAADVGTNALVQNNVIGTAADGETAIPNGGTGIFLYGGENPRNWTIAGNVISGNVGSGIEMEDSTGHVIRGNRIGVSMSGAPLGNGGDGIRKSALRGPVTIGGSAPGDGNIIGANAGHGISIDAASSGSSLLGILGNYIGITDGGSPVPNGGSGAYIKSEDVTVGGVNAGEGNMIAGNGRYGVEFGSDADVTDNFVRGNSIYGNALGGILIPAGAIRQNVSAPVITAVGSASGTSCAGCTIDVYSDDGGQGRRYEGTTVADGVGNWSFGGFVHGPYVTATASEYAPAPASPRGTSEFSAGFAFDTDVDGVANSVESPCGADMEDSGSIPERVDGAFAGVDDDGNDGADETLPAGAEDFDCDGDGYIGSVEAYVFGGAGGQDQDPCGTNGWPSDLLSGSVPDSTNRVTIGDLSTFVAPVRYIGTNVGTNAGDVRWDLWPGPGPGGADINVFDLSAIVAGAAEKPPMLGGARALNGPMCPWAP